MSETPYARLNWDDQGQPLSEAFGDVYFSRADGLAETQHVFLAHNQLAERFAALSANACFCIGETGFGTGLNFLCAWRLFEQLAPASARLHFISTERYPLCPEDLARSLALWPELEPWAKALQAAYVALVPGFQTLILANGRVRLLLLIGDASSGLEQLQAQINAWFLDGFAPARNPEMWNPRLYAALARLSAPQATLATFTSAGQVRRGLQAVGFSMQKVAGFGRKREMLCGRYTGPQEAPGKPWLTYPPLCTGRRAVVIGAGLAGCASAAALAARGWQVTLLERHEQVAAEASGNPQGVLYLKLSPHRTPQTELLLAGFGFTRRLLEHLDPSQWQACGVLQLAADAAETERQQLLGEVFPAQLLTPLERVAASNQAGTPVPNGGLFYPQAGWVHPPALCQKLLDHPEIQVCLHTPLLDFQHSAEGWHVTTRTGRLEADILIFAGAQTVTEWPQLAHLPVKAIRGQITALSAAELPALSTVVCGEGYVAPPYNGLVTLGASFNFKRLDCLPDPGERAENLERLRHLAPQLHRSALASNTTGGFERVALRCTTPDYLPLIGPVADAAAFASAYAALGRNARRTPTATCPWLPGLYVNTAHGSRGLISAPLSGELLAAWIHGEALPVAQQVAAACHPTRFLVRALMRGEDAKKTLPKQGESHG